jgi:hypothetical protein
MKDQHTDSKGEVNNITFSTVRMLQSAAYTINVLAYF